MCESKCSEVAFKLACEALAGSFDCPYCEHGVCVRDFDEDAIENCEIDGIECFEKYYKSLAEKE